MKKLVLGSLLFFVATQATGCIISSGDDDDSATITADWSFKTVAGGNLSCPPGFNTVALYNQAVDAQNRPVGQPVIDLFDCSAFHGISGPLVPDVYQTWIEVTTGSGGTVYAQSTSAIVDVITADKSFAATILDDGGYFSLSWDLRGAATTQALQCSQVAGIDGVEIISTLTTGGGAVVDKWNCEDHFGVSGGLIQGSYTVSVDAFDGAPGGGDSIGTAPALTNRVIRAPNKVTDLGNVVIPIDGM